MKDIPAVRTVRFIDRMPEKPGSAVQNTLQMNATEHVKICVQDGAVVVRHKGIAEALVIPMERVAYLVPVAPEAAAPTKK